MKTERYLTNPLGGADSRENIGRDIQLFLSLREITESQLAKILNISVNVVNSLVDGTASFGLYEANLSAITRTLKMGGHENRGLTTTKARLGDIKARKLGPLN